MSGQLNFKKDFPIFTNYPDLVYLDSAATSQKPRQVISAVNDFYTRTNSNVHRGLYDLSQQATDIYEQSRAKVAGFIGAENPAEIIFTGNASEAINLAAIGYAEKTLHPGDVVVISAMEHHSNYLPWQKLEQVRGIKLVTLPLTADFRLDYRWLFTRRIPKKKIKLVALSHASNVLGTVNPIAEIISFYRKQGINARYLVDAAQSVPHLPVNVSELGCDFLAFSSHKMLGPSGVGILWAKAELLEFMDPVFTGSHMVQVAGSVPVWSPSPEKFEVGTGRLEAVAGLGAAVDYLSRIGQKQLEAHEKELTKYALKAFSRLKNFTLYGSQQPADRLGVFAFNLKNIHPHDVAEILNRHKICVRAGHHCAQPLLRVLEVESTVRASLYLYNSPQDIDNLVSALADTAKIFAI
jgi:cysteine desulfurase/selenocysteine lyase